MISQRPTRECEFHVDFFQGQRLLTQMMPNARQNVALGCCKSPHAGSQGRRKPSLLCTPHCPFMAASPRVVGLRRLSAHIKRRPQPHMSRVFNHTARSKTSRTRTSHQPAAELYAVMMFEEWWIARRHRKQAVRKKRRSFPKGSTRSMTWHPLLMLFAAYWKQPRLGLLH